MPLNTSHKASSFQADRSKLSGRQMHAISQPRRLQPLGARLANFQERQMHSQSARRAPGARGHQCMCEKWSPFSTSTASYRCLRLEGGCPYCPPLWTRPARLAELARCISPFPACTGSLALPALDMLLLAPTSPARPTWALKPPAPASGATALL